MCLKSNLRINFYAENDLFIGVFFFVRKKKPEVDSFVRERKPISAGLLICYWLHLNDKINNEIIFFGMMHSLHGSP